METFKNGSILEIGTNRYKLYKRITGTQMSEVWLAYNHTGTPIVIKTACVNKTDNVSLNQKAIKNEFHWLHKLKTPGIIQLQSVNEISDLRVEKPAFHTPINLTRRSYLLPLEYLAGGTLKNLDCAIPKNNLFSVLTIVRNIAETLSYIHASGGVHLDIKPQNVMFRYPLKIHKVRNDIKPILIDFGLAKSIGCITKIEHASTLRWMAPECRAAASQREQIKINPSMDIYSLGLTLHYMLTGKEPKSDIYSSTVKLIHRSANAGNIDLVWGNSEILETLNYILQETLNIIPDKRPTADEIIYKIDQLLLRWNNLEIEKRVTLRNYKKGTVELEPIPSICAQTKYFNAKTILSLSVESATTILQSRINECREHGISDEGALLRRYEDLLLDINNLLASGNESSTNNSTLQAVDEKSEATKKLDEFIENNQPDISEGYSSLLGRWIGFPHKLAQYRNLRQQGSIKTENAFHTKKGIQRFSWAIATIIFMIAILLFTILTNRSKDIPLVSGNGDINSSYTELSHTIGYYRLGVDAQIVIGKVLTKLLPLPTLTPTPFPQNLVGKLSPYKIMSNVSKQLPNEAIKISAYINQDAQINAVESQHIISIDSFWIDQLEVTNDEYKRLALLDPTRYTKCWEEDQFNYELVNDMNRNQEKIAVPWESHRLSIEAEWEKAAYANNRYIEPWGTNYIKYINEKSDYQNRDNSYTIYDLAGDVKEWINTSLSEEPGKVAYINPCDTQNRTRATTYIDAGGWVVWSKDNSKILTSSNGKVRIWDMASGKPLTTLQGHTNIISSVSWSPDGTKLASGSDDHTIRIWDVASGKSLTTLQGHTSIISSVSWSPDGTKLASGSDDHTIRIWDVASGKSLTTLQSHTSTVSSVSWSPDGTKLASGSDDGIMRIWSIP